MARKPLGMDDEFVPYGHAPILTGNEPIAVIAARVNGRDGHSSWLVQIKRDGELVKNHVMRTGDDIIAMCDWLQFMLPEIAASVPEDHDPA